MVHVIDDYYIDSDKYQFIVCQKKVAEKGKNIGAERYQNLAFATTLKRALDVILNIKAREEVQKSDKLENVYMEIVRVRDLLDEIRMKMEEL